jgi:serine/threonine-protein kinase
VLRQRFEHEALSVMRLNHPYIVKIDNFGMLPSGQLYLMMEFLDGETLEEHLQRRGRCNLHHTLHIIAQVMSALQSLHESGLVHRDLKPANIFIIETEQNPYEVRLIDLGIARDRTQPESQKKTVTGMAMGTPGYMAVEQYENAADATPAADVYAAAVIVWRMLFGQPPWGDVYDERVLYFKQRSEDFAPPPGHDIPAEVIALLRKALAAEPTERVSVADFINLLASYTIGLPPFVPGGAEILNRVAKRFIKQASVNDATVRNVSHASVAAAMSWPYRGTQVPRPLHEPGAIPIPIPVLIPPPSPVMAPTANERPNASDGAPRPTTLSAVGGVVGSNSPMPPRGHRRARVLAGAAVCAIAGIATLAILLVQRDARDAGVGAASAPKAAPATFPSTSAAPASPAASGSSPSASTTPASPPSAVVESPASPNQADASKPAPSMAPPSGSTAAKSLTPANATGSMPSTRVPTRSASTATAGSKRTDSKKAATPAERAVPRNGAAEANTSKRFDPNAIVE